jgi:hypothetical protein
MVAAVTFQVTLQEYGCHGLGYWRQSKNNLCSQL